MSSKTKTAKLSKIIKSKTTENKKLENKNITLKQDLNVAKDKLERKLRHLTKKVDSQIVKATNTLGSVLGDVKNTVKLAKTKSLKLISGGKRTRKTRKTRKRKTVSWWF